MLEIHDLRVAYGNKNILNGIDLSIRQGETLAVIGESGVGKTTLGLCIAGLVQGKVSGQVLFQGMDLLKLSEQDLNKMRWNRFSLVLQNVENVLNPVMTIIKQVTEPIVEHGIRKKKYAVEKAVEVLSRAGVPSSRYEAYPHQLSGGERQRAMIAMALANDPEFIILDEPTASLDTLTRLEILKLLREVGRDRALLVITHDISAAAKLGDNIAVLYGGKLLEKGPAKEILTAPCHPYTRGLLRSYPNMTTVKDLQGIKGRLEIPQKGCCFYPRCTQAVDICREEHPPIARKGECYLACHRGGIVPLLQLKDINVNYGPVAAVKGANIKVYEGETMAMVGESGSGKSSLAYSIMGITKSFSGSIYLDGSKVKKRSKEFFRRVQMVFQNPAESISHRHNVLQAVREPLDIQNLGCDGERKEKVRRALDEVQLSSDDEFLSQYPYHLSGGEVQRVAVARALILKPAVIVADEPTSALDASVQAKVLKLLMELQQNRGLGILFITHDIALARKISDRITVMQAGEIVEEGPAERLITRPGHSYTRALLEAAPDMDFIEQEQNGVDLRESSLSSCSFLAKN
ncbi:MAG: ABC transporter ATP-binding protein [Clostridiales bacterium]|nr:ABC transporter ATP-binding protein [Clostridiales bacterium]MCF8021497.1 ABC transporter ATP-binding protein [Clostridiales bacterium]